MQAAPSSISFRDPAGSLRIVDGKIFRVVRTEYADAVLEFINSAFFFRGTAAGLFPETKVMQEFPPGVSTRADRAGCILGHDRIPFPVYPHEWLPGMLRDAGYLTLDLGEEALAAGWILKDAAASNILYSDGRPVFCDVLSFERKTSSVVWRAYAQFQRTFVLPLYANRVQGWSVHSIFMEHRDGVDPTMLAPLVRGLRRIAPMELQTIIWPAKLTNSSARRRASLIAGLASPATTDSKLSDFVMRRSFARLRRQLAAVPLRENTSFKWTNYRDDVDHYGAADRETKRAFVRRAVAQTRPRRVLDIGANTGEYSILAAGEGAAVVAVDADVPALERLYAVVKAERLRITPAVFNLVRPTPAIGWDNREVESFLNRARGQFELIIVLALLHHLMVTERVPLRFILKLFHDLDAPYLLIEWVNPTDSRFIQIAGIDAALYSELSEAHFEQDLGLYFAVIDRVSLKSGTRTLYLCERH